MRVADTPVTPLEEKLNVSLFPDEQNTMLDAGAAGGPEELPPMPDEFAKKESCVVSPFPPSAVKAEEQIEKSNGFTSELSCSFATEMLGDWKVAVQRVDGGRQLLERLSSSLLQQSSAAMEYGERIRALKDSLTIPLLESDTVRSAVSSTCAFYGQQSDHWKEFSDAIRSDVVEGTLTNTIYNHFLVLKQVHADAADSQKRLTNATADHQRAMERYIRGSKGAVEGIAKCQATEAQTPAIRTDLSLQCLHQCLEAQRAKEDYRNSVSVLNASVMDYRSRMRDILKCLEEMDTKRILCLQDALTKLLVYQAALIRNVQYDMNQTIKMVEVIESKKDIEQFIEPYRETKGPENAKVESWITLNSLYGENLRSTSPESSAPDRGVVTSTAAGVARQLAQKVTLYKFMHSAAVTLASISVGTNESINNVDNSTGFLGRSDILVDSKTLNTHQGKNQTVEKSSRSLLKFPDTFKSVSSAGSPNNPTEANLDASLAKSMEVKYERLMDIIWTPFNPIVRGSSEIVYLSAAASEFLLATMAELPRDFSSSMNRFMFLKFLSTRQRLTAAAAKDKQSLLPSIFHMRLLSTICDWILLRADEQLEAWTGRTLLLLAVQIAAEGTRLDDPQLHQTWDWRAEVEAQQALNFDDNQGNDIKIDDSVGNALEGSDDQQKVQCEEKARWSLHRCLYHHAFWNRVTFWEEALTLTISEEMQRRQLVEVWRHDGPEALEAAEREFREANPCCGCLNSFGSFMILYGIAPEQVRSLLISVSSHLRLDEQTASALLQGIRDFAEPTIAGKLNKERPAEEWRECSHEFGEMDPSVQSGSSAEAAAIGARAAAAAAAAAQNPSGVKEDSRAVLYGQGQKADLDAILS